MWGGPAAKIRYGGNDFVPCTNRLDPGRLSSNSSPVLSRQGNRKTSAHHGRNAGGSRHQRKRSQRYPAAELSDAVGADNAQRIPPAQETSVGLQAAATGKVDRSLGARCCCALAAVRQPPCWPDKPRWRARADGRGDGRAARHRRGEQGSPGVHVARGNSAGAERAVRQSGFQVHPDAAQTREHRRADRPIAVRYGACRKLADLQRSTAARETATGHSRGRARRSTSTCQGRGQSAPRDQ